MASPPSGPRGPPAGEGCGHEPSAETRIEYEYEGGHAPDGVEIEVDRDFVDEGEERQED